MCPPVRRAVRTRVPAPCVHPPRRRGRVTVLPPIAAAAAATEGDFMARIRPFVLLVLLLPIFVVACGSDDSPSIGAPPTSTTTQAPTGEQGSKIVIKNFSFNPQQLQVKVGDTVTISNDDTTTHTWTADDGSFDAGELGTGATKTQVFSKAGTVKYHCKIHTSMQGEVVVS